MFGNKIMRRRKKKKFLCAEPFARMVYLSTVILSVAQSTQSRFTNSFSSFPDQTCG
jgi:hypothetical protein